MRLSIHVCDGKLPYFVAYEIRHRTPLEYGTHIRSAAVSTGEEERVNRTLKSEQNLEN